MQHQAVQLLVLIIEKHIIIIVNLVRYVIEM